MAKIHLQHAKKTSQNKNPKQKQTNKKSNKKYQRQIKKTRYISLW